MDHRNWIVTRLRLPVVRQIPGEFWADRGPGLPCTEAVDGDE